MGKVSRQHVEIAEDELRGLTRAVKRARWAYRAATWKYRFLIMVSQLRRLASWTESKPLAATIVATPCLALAAPLLIFCQVGPMWVYIGMIGAYMFAGGASLGLLYVPDDKSFQEKFARVGEGLQARSKRVQQVFPLYQKALDRYLNLREIQQSRMNRLLRTDWRLLRGTAFEDFLADIISFKNWGTELDAKGVREIKV